MEERAGRGWDLCCETGSHPSTDVCQEKNLPMKVYFTTGKRETEVLVGGGDAGAQSKQVRT